MMWDNNEDYFTYNEMIDREVPFSDLEGKTLTRIEIFKDRDVWFYCSDGTVYLLWHYQNCCEYVTLEDVAGDWHRMLGSPLVMAEEAKNEEKRIRSDDKSGSTWTFYKLATARGNYLTLRFYGASNGYYSETMSFCRVSAAAATVSGLL